MKDLLKYKLIFFIVFFWGISLNGVANEIIKFSLNCFGIFLHITATSGEQFTIDWGDGSIITYTGTGDLQDIYYHHEYVPNSTSPFHIIITGTSAECKFSLIRVTHHISRFDASGAPSLKEIYISNFVSTNIVLDYCNVSNCVLLEELGINSCSLKNIDLRDCSSLKDILVNNNKLSELDISNTMAEYCTAAYNCLPLSQLYPITTKLAHPEWSYNYKQVVATRYTTINEPVDFSSEKEFDGVATYFLPLLGYGMEAWPPAPENDYTINDGFITFHTARTYTIYMENSKIIGADGVYTFTPVIVIVPVQEIVNVPTKAIIGTPLTLTGTVIPKDATYKIISSWRIKDIGTTGATITGNKLYTKAEGTVVVTATIKNGLGMNNYTQDFSIEVSSLSINNPTQELSNITIYPNPTNGELEIESKNLRIEKIEVLDMKGKIVLSHPFNILSAHYRIDISNLNSGIYFVKVITTQGEIVIKVVKQ